MTVRTAALGACLLALAMPAAAQPDSRPDVSGVYEGVIGVAPDELDAQVAYWEQFGYRRGPEGRLDADAAAALYGVRQPVRSVRLLHQDADHGLLRLMAWERPAPGAGTYPLRARGSRWVAALTTDAVRVANHAEEALAAGHDLGYVRPVWSQIYAVEGQEPFRSEVVGVREMLVLQPLARQVLFQRFGYTLPLYGRVHPDAFFPTSQGTHFGMIYAGHGHEHLDFYDGVLGLRRVRDGESFGPSTPGDLEIWGLAGDAVYASTDFDDPRSDPADAQSFRSGRLKIVRFPEALAGPDHREAIRPGARGLTLYTLRVRDLDAAHARVAASGATGLTPVLRDEFGARAFSFIAPDGYAWTLLEWDAHETGSTAAGAGSTGAAGTQTPEHVERVARAAFDRFAHGLASGEWEGFLGMLDPGFVFYFPQGQFAGRNEGVERAREFFAFVRTVYPEGLFATLDRVTASGDTAVFEFRDEGRMHLPQGVRDYKNRVAVALDVCGERICGYREYFGSDGTWN